MPRKGEKKPETFAGDLGDRESLGVRLRQYVEWLRVHNYSEETIRGYRRYGNDFTSWCQERMLTRPRDVTRWLLERYQRWLYHSQDQHGKPMSFRNQHARMAALRSWLKWMARQEYVETNPAAELELPRLPNRLPPVLTQSEMETLLSQTDVSTQLGLRDRAILETFYSTGIRRAELIRLQLHDVDRERGTLLVREGKGRKDRVVPIGERALGWIDSYLERVRTRLNPDTQKERTLFLTKDGEPISPTRMCFLVAGYLRKADIGKTGACHLLRHTMATLMHENGADVRFIQAMLGHARLESTQLYTQVSVRKLKQIHEATHPARPRRRSGRDTTDGSAGGVEDNGAGGTVGQRTSGTSRDDTAAGVAHANTDGLTDDKMRGPTHGKMDGVTDGQANDGTDDKTNDVADGGASDDNGGEEPA
jgi:integrase/recombinase XerD